MDSNGVLSAAYDETNRALRISASAAAAALATDPAFTGTFGTFSDNGWPSGLEASMSRIAANSATAISCPTGWCQFTFFTAKTATTRSNMTVYSGGTAAGATPTLVRAGIYSVDGSGNLTLTNSIANDTAILASTFTSYTRTLKDPTGVTNTPWTPTIGARYAYGLVVVTGAAIPTVVGSNFGGAITSISGSAPRLAARVTGQTDLPASVAVGSLVNNQGGIYMEAA